MGAADYLQAIKPDTAKLRKIIDNGLLFDWVIRIEYSGGAADGESWQQWEEAQLAPCVVCMWQVVGVYEQGK